jgi:hypothetical protein
MGASGFVRVSWKNIGQHDTIAVDLQKFGPTPENLENIWGEVKMDRIHEYTKNKR